MTFGALLAVFWLGLGVPEPAQAQTPPTAVEVAGYSGLHLAAHLGDIAALEAEIGAGADIEALDRSGRRAVHIAAFASREDALHLLAAAGADMDALDRRAYDAVTIAAVAGDLEMLRAALDAGNRADLVASVYDGTALIAAAHLGHWQVVEMLIAAGAPLDHINNIGWTALIEAVVLGNGGPDHQRTVAALVGAGADTMIGDSDGVTPLAMAEARGYSEIAAIIRARQ